MRTLSFRAFLCSAVAACAFTDLPETWDWRSVNGTNWLDCCGAEVRNHHEYPPAEWGSPYTGGCASCWAFSSTSVLSDRLYIQSRGKIRALPSANVLLDCAPGAKRCGYPGSASNAYNYLKHHGIPDESCSPTVASLGGNAQHCEGKTPCPGICSSSTFCRNRTDGQHGSQYTGPLYGVESFSSMVAPTADEIRAEIHEFGPVAAGMCVDGGGDGGTGSIMNYTGGVILASGGVKCTKVNHDVNLVGWGVDAGVPYWLARNNWGRSWGEGGFFRIERGQDAFIIESHVRTVKGKIFSNQASEAIV